MCWTNNIAIPIVLKKPLRVYKVGTTIFDNFISLFQGYVYHKCQAMPTVEIDPKFERYSCFAGLGELWKSDRFYIHKGYHSYLTEKGARFRCDEYDDIGIFEIPAGATIYINYKRGEVVSTDIKYLGVLKE